MNRDAVLLIEDPPMELVLTRKPIYEWPEPNTLDDAANANDKRLHSRWRAYDTAATLPANLNHFAVFHQNRNSSLSLREGLHANKGFGIRFDIVFEEIAAFELEPLPQFLRVRTA
jgi:hypothetical protein